MKGLEQMKLLNKKSSNNSAGYHIETKISGPWWWRQTQYWIMSDYGCLGPYDRKSEAEDGLRMIKGFEAKYGVR